METAKELDEFFYLPLQVVAESALVLKIGMKCENSYALEALFAAPFTMMFPIEIFVISTESGPNITRFGEPI